MAVLSVLRLLVDTANSRGLEQLRSETAWPHALLAQHLGLDTNTQPSDISIADGEPPQHLLLGHHAPDVSTELAHCARRTCTQHSLCRISVRSSGNLRNEHTVQRPSCFPNRWVLNQRSQQRIAQHEPFAQHASSAWAE